MGLDRRCSAGCQFKIVLQLRQPTRPCISTRQSSVIHKRNVSVRDPLPWASRISEWAHYMPSMRSTIALLRVPMMSALEARPFHAESRVPLSRDPRYFMRGFFVYTKNNSTDQKYFNFVNDEKGNLIVLGVSLNINLASDARKRR